MIHNHCDRCQTCLSKPNSWGLRGGIANDPNGPPRYPILTFIKNDFILSLKDTECAGVFCSKCLIYFLKAGVEENVE